jgi:hypothetical protein
MNVSLTVFVCLWHFNQPVYERKDYEHHQRGQWFGQ